MGGNKGGGTTSTTTSTTTQYDEASSRKLAEIAGRQQEMAEEQWALYQEYFMPYEIEAAQANREILPLITEASKTTLGLQKPVTEQFYKESLEGIDVGKRVDQAGAEVINATRLGQGMRRREMSRYGLDPSSQTYSNLANLTALETSKNVAGARTTARNIAETEKYNRLGYSLGKGVYQTQVGPNVDPYARAAGSFAGAASGYSSLANRVLGTTGRGGAREKEFQTPLGAGGSAGGAILGAGATVLGAALGSK